MSGRSEPYVHARCGKTPRQRERERRSFLRTMPKSNVSMGRLTLLYKRLHTISALKMLQYATKHSGQAFSCDLPNFNAAWSALTIAATLWPKSCGAVIEGCRPRKHELIVPMVDIIDGLDDMRLRDRRATGDWKSSSRANYSGSSPRLQGRAFPSLP